MTRNDAILLVAFAATLAGGCTALPATGAAATVSRPMSDLSPANEVEARARVHVDLGMAYFGVGRNDVALDEAKVALADSPSYAPAFHLMGLVYMLIGESATAAANFEQALRLAPGDPDFNNSYGWFLCTQGREADGLERLALAARNPYYKHQDRPYTNAGLCHLRLKDDAAAEVQFTKALQADVDNGQALYQLAEIAYRRGDYALARSHLIRLHQRLGTNAASAWLGLRTERRLGNQDAEASYASQLSSRFADSAEYQQMTEGKYE